MRNVVSSSQLRCKIVVSGPRGYFRPGFISVTDGNGNGLGLMKINTCRFLNHVKTFVCLPYLQLDHNREAQYLQNNASLSCPSLPHPGHVSCFSFLLRTASAISVVIIPVGTAIIP